MKLSTGTSYLSSIVAANKIVLKQLSGRMHNYYASSPYPDWARAITTNWVPATHSAQLEMCKHLPPGSRVLEVGCADGHNGHEIMARSDRLKYVGVDLAPGLWKRGGNFAVASAEALPFRSGSIDVVLSMFVLEHLVFPASFLDEAWRVLQPAGRLLIVTPDFASNAMPSERVGIGYGSGRDKLKQGKLLDALLTAYDNRVRIYWSRCCRRNQLRHGLFSFPILAEPRCLRLRGFTPDCDAVYPASPEEVVNYLRQRNDYGASEVFYRDTSTFGLLVVKQ